MSEVETLVEGSHFKSGWIDRAVYDPRGGTESWGLCAITIKGTPYGYVIRRDTWERFRQEAERSLEDDDASTGSAYNKYLKHAATQDAADLGKVDLPDDLRPGSEAPNIPADGE